MLRVPPGGKSGRQSVNPNLFLLFTHAHAVPCHGYTHNVTQLSAVSKHNFHKSNLQCCQPSTQSEKLLDATPPSALVPFICCKSLRICALSGRSFFDCVSRSPKGRDMEVHNHQTFTFKYPSRTHTHTHTHTHTRSSVCDSTSTPCELYSM